MESRVINGIFLPVITVFLLCGIAYVAASFGLRATILLWPGLLPAMFDVAAVSYRSVYDLVVTVRRRPRKEIDFETGDDVD